MKIGISTFNLENNDFQVQLHSLLKNNIKPHFIILHYGGYNYKILKYLRYLNKTIKHHKFKSLKIILERSKSFKIKSKIKDTLSQNEKNEIKKILKQVPIIKTGSINDRSTINKLKKYEASIIVCNSGVLKKEIINLNNIIFLNIHSSELPKYRGMNNIEWALYENSSIYVTVHKISIGIDEGDILYQEKININNKELKTIDDYRKFCFNKSNEVIGKAIRQYLNNEINFKEQNNKRSPIFQYYVMHPILKNHLQEKLNSMA